MTVEKETIFKKELLDKINLSTEYQKQYTQEYMQRAIQAEKDMYYKDRLKNRLCMSCYYLQETIFACTEITQSNCKICDKEMIFGTSLITPICDECAKKYRLCKQCMCDINFKKRRKI